VSARCLIAAVALLGLAACTEPSQERQQSSSISKPLYEGTGSNFTAKGWTQGDKASWQRELKTRTQRGQNEYTKVY